MLSSTVSQEEEKRNGDKSEAGFDSKDDKGI